MNYLLYGIIITSAIFFILIILLIIILFKTKSEILLTSNNSSTMPDLSPIGYLIIKSGADRGRVYKIEKNSITIGSGETNSIIIKDESVSPSHSMIWMHGKKFFIKDLGSRTGTKVNNKIIEQTELFDNDVVMIGNNIFVFKVLN